MSIELRYAVVGMSHIVALARGWDQIAAVHPDSDCLHYGLRRFRVGVSEAELRLFKHPPSDEEMAQIRSLGPSLAENAPSGYVDATYIREQFARAIADCEAVVFLIEGNEYNLIGMLDLYPMEDSARIVGNGVRLGMTQWLDILLPACAGKRLFVTQAPPPFEGSEELLERMDRAFQAKLDTHRIRDPEERLALWRAQCETVADVGRLRGLELIPLPTEVFTGSGYLAREYLGSDATHANPEYGAVVSAHLQRVVSSALRNRTGRSHPYVGLPPHSYWKRAVAGVDRVEPLASAKFQVSPKERIATAGSCFAGHIAQRLATAGFNIVRAEQPYPGVQDGPAYSANYGNVYTARQLVQLFDRAFGRFTPGERAWRRTDGRWCDPFRPRIREDGFASAEEVAEATRQHLSAVRDMFRSVDTFVFTLGLTECWLCAEDDAALPMAPGVAGGEFDPAKYRFVNFTADEIVQDMRLFFRRLRHVNPSARMIVTVSPVPLAATATGNHVLHASTLSKATLRVAAEMVCNADPDIQYFPSYEIITAPQAGSYFTDDLRSIAPEGVEHVMGVFMRRVAGIETGVAAAVAAPAVDAAASALAAEFAKALDASCDEQLYARDA